MDKIREKFSNIAFFVPHLSLLPEWIDISSLIKRILASKFVNNDFSHMTFHDLYLCKYTNGSDRYLDSDQILNFSHCKLYSCSFSKAILEKTVFDHAKFLYCSFSETELHQVSFIKAEITKTTFSIAAMNNCVLSSSIIDSTSFNRAHIQNTSFSNSIITDSSFDSEIYTSNFNDAVIKKCNFMGVFIDDKTLMHKTHLVDCDLSSQSSNDTIIHCDLSNAIIKNTRFIRTRMIEDKYNGGVYEY